MPLPASLVVAWPGVTITGDDEVERAGEGDAGAAEDAVRARLAAAIGPASEGDDEVPLVVGGRPALRRARVTRGRPEVRGVEPTDATRPEAVREIETVESRVFAIQPGGRVLVLSFSCGMPALRDDLVAVFDLIAMTLHWEDDDGSPSVVVGVPPLG